MPGYGFAPFVNKTKNGVQRVRRLGFSLQKHAIYIIVICRGKYAGKNACEKKTAKNAQKPVKKPGKKNAQKVTLDDLLKAQGEAWKAMRETDKALKEANLRTEESKDEAWAAIRETQKNIGGLNNTLGSIIEHLLTPGLPQKFKKMGYSFNRIATYKFAEGVYAQIDGMLENGEQAVAVEVKTTLRQADIDDHLVRMEKIRKYADEYNDKRQFMGAMVAMITDDSPREYALKKGLFVIEPSGDDVRVTRPEGK